MSLSSKEKMVDLIQSQIRRHRTNATGAAFALARKPWDEKLQRRAEVLVSVLDAIVNLGVEDMIEKHWPKGDGDVS